VHKSYLSSKPSKCTRVTYLPNQVSAQELLMFRKYCYCVGTFHALWNLWCNIFVHFKSSLCRHNESYKYKDASRKQRKWLDLKLITKSHLFWGNCHCYQKSDTQLKRPIPNWLKKAWVFTEFTWSLSVSLKCIF